MSRFGAPSAGDGGSDLLNLGPPARAGTSGTVAIFWGICDVKYNPRLPERERVVVLELGDGRMSRFSNHGKSIRTKFESEYWMAHTPIKRAVLVENKRFTHDMFVRKGFRHLRPPTANYPRRYEPNLASMIVADLAAQCEAAVVLKLCNRSRGAGVVVAPVGELDAILRRLLEPPEGAELQAMLERRMPGALCETFAENFEEQCLHWWSNECPSFLAERRCRSEPVAVDNGSGEQFDGTLRVAFALHQHMDEQNGLDTLGSSGKYKVDWLGGYWKLPRLPMVVAEEQDEGNLEEMHARVVSSFKSADKRTMEVSPEGLAEVCGALTPALQAVFQSGDLTVPAVMADFRNDAAFCSFVLSRIASSMRDSKPRRAEGLYQLARDLVMKSVNNREGVPGLPERAVLSYIERNIGVCGVLQHDWKRGIEKANEALRRLPTNSTSHYLEGCCHFELGAYDDAAGCLLKSIMFDPDFKLPYIMLGNCHLRARRFQGAIDASEACLRRHPDSPGAKFNLGQAAYHLLQDNLIKPEEVAEKMHIRAGEFLDYAKRRMPDQWSCADEKMLEYFLAEPGARGSMPQQLVHTWKVIGWRP